MDKCKGCLKYRNNECIAFNDIEYQHKRKGGCYGKVTKPEQIAKMYEDIANYTEDITAKKVFLREARLWRKKAWTSIRR